MHLSAGYYFVFLIAAVAAVAAINQKQFDFSFIASGVAVIVLRA